MLATTLTKNSTKKLDKEIFQLKENIRILEDRYELTLLDYSILTSPKKLMEYQQFYFEDKFIQKKIENLSKIELIRMGAKLKQNGSRVIINGTEKLVGAEVMATDLRASSSLVIAGLMAKGKTTINRVYHLDRGYENIEEKLKLCGAKIERLKQ